MPEQHMAYLILILITGPVITYNRKLSSIDSFQGICIMFFFWKIGLEKIASIICNFNLMKTEKIT